MRKFRVLTALATTTLVVVTACSTSTGSSSSDGSFRVLTSANSGRPGLEAVAPDFATQSGVSVKTEFGETGGPAYASQLLTQLQNGSAPDVFSAFSGTGTSVPTVGELSRSGTLMDLSETDMAKNVPDLLRPAVTIDGKVYGCVLGAQYTGLIYNTDLFEKHGLKPPQTFDEMVTLVKKIREVAPDSIPIAYAGGHKAISMIVLSQFAASEPGFTGKETSFVDSAAWKGATDQLQTLKDAGAYSPSVATDDANAILTQMSSQKAFMMVDVTSRYAALKRLDANLPIAMAPYPGRTKASTRILLYPGTMAAVNAKTTQPDVAKRWIDFIATPDVTKKWTEAAGGSELTAAQLDGKEQLPAQYQPLTSVKQLVMIPAVTWPGVGTGNGLGEDIPSMLGGLKTSDQVLADMDANWGK